MLSPLPSFLCYSFGLFLINFSDFSSLNLVILTSETWKMKETRKMIEDKVLWWLFFTFIHGAKGKNIYSWQDATVTTHLNKNHFNPIDCVPSHNSGKRVKSFSGFPTGTVVDSMTFLLSAICFYYILSTLDLVLLTVYGFLFLSLWRNSCNGHPMLRGNGASNGCNSVWGRGASCSGEPQAAGAQVWIFHQTFMPYFFRY